MSVLTSPFHILIHILYFRKYFLDFKYLFCFSVFGFLGPSIITVLDFLYLTFIFIAFSHILFIFSAWFSSLLCFVYSVSLRCLLTLLFLNCFSPPFVSQSYQMFKILLYFSHFIFECFDFWYVLFCQSFSRFPNCFKLILLCVHMCSLCLPE